jgi:multiple sugar transport system substrate-binding protein
MSKLTFNRRDAIKTTGAAAGLALSAATILTPRKSLAQRAERLVYWHIPTFTPAADEHVRDQFNEFLKMAGVKEEDAAFVVVSNQDLVTRLAAALETGTPPDVTRLYESYVQLYRAQGHMMDVTDLVQNMKSEEGGLFDSSLTAVAYDGKYWGVPFAINPWPMHVRMDVLEEHGLDYPRTWEAFVETCLKVQKPPFYGFGMDLGLTQDATDNIMQLCWCFGGRTVDENNQVVFDSPENVAGFTFINEMYNTHKIIPRGVVGNGDTAWNNKAYQSGQVAFINNPTSVYAYLAGEDPELMKKTGLFGVPAGPAGAINQIDTWSLGVFSAAPEPELARGLAAHFMQPSLYNDVITNTNGRFVPVYPNLFNDPWWTERPEFSEFIDIASTGVPISYAGPPTAASGEILATNVIPEALQLVLVEGLDPAEAVGEAHQKIAAVYERLAE